MLESRFSFQVFADYHQFYVLDGGENPPFPEAWTDHDVAARAKAVDHLVAICPVRNTEVPAVLELHDRQPHIDLSSYDHVVVCSLDLPTGDLQVLDGTGGEVLRRLVPPGSYRVLALYQGLGTLMPIGLEGHDSYRIVLFPWPSPEPLVVLKAWHS